MATLSHHSHRRDEAVGWSIDYHAPTLSWQLACFVGGESFYVGGLERAQLRQLEAAVAYALSESGDVPGELLEPGPGYATDEDRGREGDEAPSRDLRG